MAAWKLGPALACGNTVILKPAEQTPADAPCSWATDHREAGLPEGVVNIVTGFGPGAGSSIAEHPGIDKVAFTGSTEVGKIILQASAGNLKKVSLELGGKAPNIIFPDADLDQAVPTAMMGVYFNSGQVCCAGTRIFVQRDRYDEVVDKFSQLQQERQRRRSLRSQEHARTAGFARAVRSRQELPRCRQKGRRQGLGGRQRRRRQGLLRSTHALLRT